MFRERWTAKEYREGKPTTRQCPDCGAELFRFPSTGIGAPAPLHLKCKKCGYNNIKPKQTPEKRLKEIIQIAGKLGWIRPLNEPKIEAPEAGNGSLFVPSYPLMQLSEVEKCMLAMVNDDELKRLREWAAPAPR